METQLHIIQEKDQLNAVLSSFSERQKFVLVDENTHQHCWPKLLEACPSLKDAELIEVPPGEDSKSMDIAYQLWITLSSFKADRKALLINLGGGVITDLGGFVGSTFKRGIPFVHIPTTLLGMVDASIGGKTGINLEQEKNMVGTFSTAASTIIYPKFLDTLDAIEIKSGFAEMLKHGLIADKQHWNELINLETIHTATIYDLIARSCEIKKNIVETDFRESGQRKLLNAGHTFGHALESWKLENQNPIPHGFAVAEGLIFEALLSNQMGILNDDDTASIVKSIRSYFPKLNHLPENTERMLTFMGNDKKNVDQKINFSLLSAIGQGAIDVFVKPPLIITTYQTYLNT